MRAIHTFKSTSKAELNDLYVPGAPEQFSPGLHQFHLTPKTRFWRFGVMLSKTSNVERPVNNRYDFSLYRYIQVVAGEIKSNTLRKNPRQLEIGNMQEPEHPFFAIDDYEPMTEVTLEVNYHPLSESIYVACTTVGLARKEYLLRNVEPLSHFKVFAWADWTAFELEYAYYKQSDLETESDEEQPMRSFSPVQNLIFKNTDIFDEKDNPLVDLLVLPVASNGNVNSDVLREATVLGFTVPDSKAVGTLALDEPNRPLSSVKGAWAYSVEGSEGSSLEIISKVMGNLVKVSSENRFNHIVIPLLGTGAGNLEQVDVAKLYCETWRKVSDRPTLVVCIPKKTSYNSLKKAIETWIQEKYFGSTLPNLLGRNEVDGVLGVKKLAVNLAGLLSRMPTDQDTMMGIFGKWGRGKTRLMDEIFAVLNEDKKAIRIDFHAWKYQDTPASWAYLYEQFSEQYFNEYNSKWHQFWRKIALNINRLGKWKWVVFLLSLGLVIYISFGISYWTKIKFVVGLLGTIGIGGAISLYFIYKRFGKTAKSLIKEYSKKVSFAHYLGVQAEVQKELGKLLQTWTRRCGSKGKRIYLFVDDIDRCSEENIIRVVDALRVMVEDQEISKRVVIIAAIDDRILKRAIEFKYKELIDTQKKDKKEFENLTKEYFDKLFITGVKLSDLNENDRDEFFTAAVQKFRNQASLAIAVSETALEVASTSQGLGNTEDEMTAKGNVSKKELSSITESPDDPVKTKVSTASTETIETIEKPGVWISDEEYDLFKECLRNCPVITPRQIKIVFYRYLLAKAVLDSVYESKRNIWRVSVNSRIMMNALILKSFAEDFDFNKIKRNHPKNAKPTATEDDFGKLLNVVDLVVAY